MGMGFIVASKERYLIDSVLIRRLAPPARPPNVDCPSNPDCEFVTHRPMLDDSSDAPGKSIE
jgi:hypothetical protein